MPHIITDTSPAAMARGIEENLIVCYGSLAMPGGYRADDALTTIRSGIPAGDFNGVFRAQFPPDLPPDQLETRIRAVLSDLDGWHVPYQWYVMPLSQPPDLARHLGACGLRLHAASPGMAVDLQALNEDVPVPPGFAIAPVRDAAALHTWLDTGFAGFGMPAEFTDVFVERMRGFDLSPAASAQLHLGTLDGTPVATSMCFMGAGVAGLYTIATLADYRGQGIGAAMTLAPLREAREHGYRIGTLEASKMGFPVYQRLGFQQYITIEHYERADAAD